MLEEGDKTYNCIISIAGEQSYFLVYEMKNEERLFIQPGQKVYVKIIADNEVIQFPSVIKLQHFQRKIIVYVLEKPDFEEVVRTQKRNYIRASCNIPVRYLLLEKEHEGDWVQICPEIETTTINFSVAGAKIVTSEQVPVGKFVVLKFKVDVISKEEDFLVLGKTRCCKKLQKDGYGVGVEFLEISDEALLCLLFYRQTLETKSIILHHLEDQNIELPAPTIHHPTSDEV